MKKKLKMKILKRYLWFIDNSVDERKKDEYSIKVTTKKRDFGYLCVCFKENVSRRWNGNKETPIDRILDWCDSGCCAMLYLSFNRLNGCTCLYRTNAFARSRQMIFTPPSLAHHFESLMMLLLMMMKEKKWKKRFNVR